MLLVKNNSGSCLSLSGGFHWSTGTVSLREHALTTNSQDSNNSEDSNRGIGVYSLITQSWESFLSFGAVVRFTAFVAS